MADIRTFQANHKDLDIEVTLTIDFDMLTVDHANEIVNFSLAEEHRSAAGNEESRAIVAQLAAQFFIAEIIVRFSPPVTALNLAIEEAEGWGGYAYNGIKLIDYDSGISVGFEDIECIEVEAETADG